MCLQTDHLGHVESIPSLCPSVEGERLAANAYASEEMIDKEEEVGSCSYTTGANNTAGSSAKPMSAKWLVDASHHGAIRATRATAVSRKAKSVWGVKKKYLFRRNGDIWKPSLRRTR